MGLWLKRCAHPQALSAGNYIARVSFGVALVTSVAVVWIAIFAILSSANTDRDDRCGSSSKNQLGAVCLLLQGFYPRSSFAAHQLRDRACRGVS